MSMDAEQECVATSPAAVPSGERAMEYAHQRTAALRQDGGGGRGLIALLAELRNRSPEADHIRVPSWSSPTGWRATTRNQDELPIDPRAWPSGLTGRDDQHGRIWCVTYH